MTRGRSLVLVWIAFALLVGGVSVCAIREHLPRLVVVPLVLVDLVAIAVLFGFAWRRR